MSGFSSSRMSLLLLQVQWLIIIQRERGRERGPDRAGREGGREKERGRGGREREEEEGGIEGPLNVESHLII